MHTPPPVLCLPHCVVSDLRRTLLATVCSIFPVLKTHHLYVIGTDRGKPGMYSKKRGEEVLSLKGSLRMGV